jgi:hypothetical protein
MWRSLLFLPTVFLRVTVFHAQTQNSGADVREGVGFPHRLRKHYALHPLDLKLRCEF